MVEITEIIYFIWCYFGGAVIGTLVMCRGVGYFTGSIILDRMVDNIFDVTIFPIIGLFLFILIITYAIIIQKNGK